MERDKDEAESAALSEAQVLRLMDGVSVLGSLVWLVGRVGSGGHRDTLSYIEIHSDTRVSVSTPDTLDTHLSSTGWFDDTFPWSVPTIPANR